MFMRLFILLLVFVSTITVYVQCDSFSSSSTTTNTNQRRGLVKSLQEDEVEFAKSIESFDEEGKDNKKDDETSNTTNESPSASVIMSPVMAPTPNKKTPTSSVESSPSKNANSSTPSGTTPTIAESTSSNTSSLSEGLNAIAQNISATITSTTNKKRKKRQKPSKAKSNLTSPKEMSNSTTPNTPPSANIGSNNAGGGDSNNTSFHDSTKSENDKLKSTKKGNGKVIKLASFTIGLDNTIMDSITEDDLENVVATYLKSKMMLSEDDELKMDAKKVKEESPKDNDKKTNVMPKSASSTTTDSPGMIIYEFEGTVTTSQNVDQSESIIQSFLWRRQRNALLDDNTNQLRTELYNAIWIAAAGASGSSTGNNNNNTTNTTNSSASNTMNSTYEIKFTTPNGNNASSTSIDLYMSDLLERPGANGSVLADGNGDYFSDEQSDPASDNNNSNEFLIRRDTIDTFAICAIVFFGITLCFALRYKRYWNRTKVNFVNATTSASQQQDVFVIGDDDEDLKRECFNNNKNENDGIRKSNHELKNSLLHNDDENQKNNSIYFDITDIEGPVADNDNNGTPPMDVNLMKHQKIKESFWVSITKKARRNYKKSMNEDQVAANNNNMTSSSPHSNNGGENV